ncbi:MAG: FHA domain-containing protein [Halothece sp.]
MVSINTFESKSPNLQPTLAQQEPEKINDSLSAGTSREQRIPMLKVNLLNPQSSVPLQTWRIEANSLITIGRSPDNQITLASAVLSRYHLKIQPTKNGWELVNLGWNGTFYQGKRIERTPLTKGMVIQLANTGPKLQIEIESIN